MKTGGFTTLALYLGIGALFHAFMIGPQFDWSSAWTWGWLLGWPIMIFIAFWAVILGVAAIAILVAIGIAISESDAAARWRANRMMKRAARKVRQ